MKKIFIRVFIVTVGIFFILILLEICLRITGYIYEKKPAEEIYNKEKTNFIILCLGDSHTRGMGAPQGFDYPSQLSTLLNKNSSKKYKVINEGIVTQNTSQLLFKLPVFINIYKPDLIILLTGGANKKWNYYGYNSSKLNDFFYRIRLVKLFYLLLNNVKEKNSLSLDFNDNFILENKNFRDSLSSLFEQLKKNQFNDRVYYKIGLLYLQENRCNDAIKYFKKALDINKNETNYFLSISNSYRLTGSYDEALKYLKSGLKLNKSCDKLLLEGTKIFIEKADYSKALEMIENGIIYNPLCINFYQYLNGLRNINYEISSNIDTFYLSHKINTSEKHYYIYDNYNINEFCNSKLNSLSNDNVNNIKWIKRDLIRLVGTIRKSNIRLILMNYYYNDIANSVIEETAKENNIPFVNNHEVFLHLGKDIMKYREPIGYGFGGHPNSKGYELIAHNINNELKKLNIK